MRIKVCGMKHNIEEVASLGPDFLGLIFWEGSPRAFSGLLPSLPDPPEKVGVFVDAPLEEVLTKIKAYGLRLVQLHGNESPSFCGALKERLAGSEFPGTEVGIIKVFSVKGSFDFNRLRPYEAVCDYYLFDAKGELPGGNGYGFDWQLLAGYPSRKPYFLSGGIGAAELPILQEFIKQPVARYCYAVDVNSRFESEPGRKIIPELRKFINAVSPGTETTQQL